MTKSDLIKAAQRQMGLVEDGDWGPVTTAKALNYDFELKLERKVKEEPSTPVKVTGEWFGAPWVGAAPLHLLGRDETDKELNAWYVPEWAKEGLPGYKTLSGNTHAWCSVRENADKRRAGVKGTNSAGAASWSKWGKKCPFWFGCTLDIQHATGGRHVCTFLYWIDEKNKICATLDGNRSNKLGIFRTDISGHGDKCVTGPRWSNDVPDGKLVSMAEVLKAYPMLKVGSTGSGTR